MASAAVPGWVEGGMAIAAMPFLKVAAWAVRDERDADGARTPRIFPRRMDSSKSDGRWVGGEFFLETRSESALSARTSKESASFSVTIAAGVGGFFEGSAGVDGWEIDLSLGPAGVAETGRTMAGGGGGMGGGGDFAACLVAQPERDAARIDANANPQASGDTHADRMDSGVRAGKRLSNIREGAGIETRGIDARPGRR